MGLIFEAETTLIGSVVLWMSVSIDDISALVELVADCEDLLTGLVFRDSVVKPLYEIVDDSLFALAAIAELPSKDEDAAAELTAVLADRNPVAKSGDEIMVVIVFLIRDVVSVAESVNLVVVLGTVVIVEVSLCTSLIVGEVLIKGVVALESEVVVV